MTTVPLIFALLTPLLPLSVPDYKQLRLDRNIKNRIAIASHNLIYGKHVFVKASLYTTPVIVQYIGDW